MAILLGRAREKSNDRTRARMADRGPVGNRDVDLHGALGELLLLRSVMERGPASAADYMRRHMFNPAGGRGVEGPDLELEKNGQRHGFDMKSFDCAPNKKFFAINDDKHQALRGKCIAYLAFVAPTLQNSGVISKLVPYVDVDTWKAWPLRAGGNPSRNYPVQQFMAKYMPDPQAYRRPDDRILVQADIDQQMKADGPDGAHQQLIRLIPTLKDRI